MNKYKLLEREANGLCRIKALRDFGDVKKGDIGGYVEKENNLSQLGNAWVYGNARVTKDVVNLIGLKYDITLSDNHVRIGCKQFTFEKALKLHKRWKQTKEKYEEASEVEDIRKVVVELIKSRMREL